VCTELPLWLTYARFQLLTLVNAWHANACFWFDYLKFHTNAECRIVLSYTEFKYNKCFQSITILCFQNIIMYIYVVNNFECLKFVLCILYFFIVDILKYCWSVQKPFNFNTKSWDTTYLWPHYWHDKVCYFANSIKLYIRTATFLF